MPQFPCENPGDSSACLAGPGEGAEADPRLSPAPFLKRPKSLEKRTATCHVAVTTLRLPGRKPHTEETRIQGRGRTETAGQAGASRPHPAATQGSSPRVPGAPDTVVDGTAPRAPERRGPRPAPERQPRPCAVRGRGRNDDGEAPGLTRDSRHLRSRPEPVRCPWAPPFSSAARGPRCLRSSALPPGWGRNLDLPNLHATRTDEPAGAAWAQQGPSSRGASCPGRREERSRDEARWRRGAGQRRRRSP